jgi:hypothetical protein
MPSISMIITKSISYAKDNYEFVTFDKFTNYPKKHRIYFNNFDGTANIPLGNNNIFSDSKPSASMKNVKYKWGFTLREEQDYILNYIKENQLLSWTIMMKTGRWKTLVMLKLIEFFKRPTLILCHNLDNVDAIASGIANDLDDRVTRVRSWVKKEFWPICVTTHSWFRSKPEIYLYNWKPYDIILYDECDYNLSFPTGSNRKQISMSTSLINYGNDILFWLSWTPFLKELWEKGVTKMFGDVIAMPEQENGWYNILPTVEVKLYKNPTFYLYENRHQLVAVVQEDEVRTDAITEYVKEKAWNFNLALFKFVDEVDKFYKILSKELNIPIIKLHWRMSKAEYDLETNRLNWLILSKHKFLIVGTADKIWRWKDIPILDTMFLLYPCKFEWSVIQAVGRGLRSFPWKDKVMLHDWRDAHPVLLSQGKKRVKTYFKEYPWCDVYQVW